MRRPVTLVDDAESDVQALAKRGHEQLQALRKAIGERKYNEVPLKPEDKAMLFLPYWETLGQAADTDEQGQPLGRLFWQWVHDNFGGPKAVVQFDHEMRTLHEKFSPDWVSYMPPQLARAYQDLVARGLHEGKPRESLKEPSEGRETQADGRSARDRQSRPAYSSGPSDDR